MKPSLFHSPLSPITKLRVHELSLVISLRLYCPNVGCPLMANFVTGERGQKRFIQHLKPMRRMSMSRPSSFSSTYSTAACRVSHTPSFTRNILTPPRPHTWLHTNAWGRGPPNALGKMARWPTSVVRLRGLKINLIRKLVGALKQVDARDWAAFVTSHALILRSAAPKNL